MKAACPRCQRNIPVDDQVGDFPTRCAHCGTLVRRRAETTFEPDARLESAPPAATRIERGMLAGLLISRTESDPGVIRANPGTVITASAGHSVLQPESRREVLRARARQQALVRAQVQTSQRTLAALTWAGLALVLVLAAGAIALKAQSMWRHPTPARADVLRVQ